MLTAEQQAVVDLYNKAIAALKLAEGYLNTITLSVSPKQAKQTTAFADAIREDRLEINDYVSNLCEED